MALTAYAPLDKTRLEVRLLTLRAGAPESPLDCALHPASLLPEEIPEYGTISYCWGDASKVTPICLNGLTVEIPVQADAALRSARRVDRDRIVWIDSVCINQRDDTEKGHQVDMMAEIYKRSVVNLVYLGDSHDEGTAALPIQKIIAFQQASYKRYYTQDKDSRSLNPIEAAEEVAMAMGISPTDVECVYSSGWFRRLWTAQEYILAPRNVVICGDMEGDLTSIIKAAGLLFFLDEVLDWKCDRSGIDRDQADIQGGGLMTLLSTFGHRICSRLEDKVYGLIGLYKDVMGSQELPPCLQPDYQKDPHEVILAVTRYTMIEEGKFNIRHYAVSRSRTVQFLPSWVRDWTRGDAYVESDERPFFSERSRAPCKACGDGQLKILAGLDASADLRVLRVQGLPIIAALEEVAPPPIEHADLFEHAKAMCTKLCVSYETLAKTLIGSDVEDALSMMLAFGLVYNIDVGLARTEGEGDSSSAHDRGTIDWFATLLDDTCLQRSLFTTDDGRLGIGPRTAVKGDLLAVIAGCELPVVLRPAGHQYRIVGPAFVDGISYGEAVTAFLQSGEEVEEYELI